MTEEQKANELVEHALEFQRTGLLDMYQEVKQQYEMALLVAEYVAVCCQWEHPKESERHNYWKGVKTKIESKSFTF